VTASSGSGCPASGQIGGCGGERSDQRFALAGVHLNNVISSRNESCQELTVICDEADLAFSGNFNDSKQTRFQALKRCAGMGKRLKV